MLINYLKKYPAIRSVGRCCLKILSWPKKKVEEIRFLMKCDNSIKDIQRVLEKEKFIFCFGTLLGIVRDNKILGRDLDIDIGVLVESEKDIAKIRNLLVLNGYKQHVRFTVDTVGINQEAFFKNRVNIDVSYFFLKNERYITYLLYEKDKVLMFDIGNKFSIKKICYKNMMINVPSNAESVLENIYGSDWRIPNKSYKYWENKCATKLTLKGATLDFNVKK